MKNVTIYINLPEEGSPTRRPTQATDLGNGFFHVLATPDYNPEDEVWEFPPGSIVQCEKKLHKGQEYFLAVKKAG